MLIQEAKLNVSPLQPLRVGSVPPPPAKEEATICPSLAAPTGCAKKLAWGPATSSCTAGAPAPLMTPHEVSQALELLQT